jgi:hypothetical protein
LANSARVSSTYPVLGTGLMSIALLVDGRPARSSCSIMRIDCSAASAYPCMFCQRGLSGSPGS